MLFFYYPVDENQTDRVYMGSVVAIEDYEDENEIDVRTAHGWFTLRRDLFGGGWTHRDGLDVIDASLVGPG
jgi:hypothetical protein